MAKPDACSSYRIGEMICADGFIQRFTCWNQNGCVHCGKPASPKYQPYCLRDDLPDHFVTESGAPRFYKLSGDGSKDGGSND